MIKRRRCNSLCFSPMYSQREVRRKLRIIFGKLKKPLVCSHIYRISKRKVLVLNQLLFQGQDSARLLDPAGNSISCVKEDSLFGLHAYLIHKEEICIESGFRLCRLCFGERKQICISKNSNTTNS